MTMKLPRLVALIFCLLGTLCLSLVQSFSVRPLSPSSISRSIHLQPAPYRGLSLSQNQLHAKKRRKRKIVESLETTAAADEIGVGDGEKTPKNAEKPREVKPRIAMDDGPVSLQVNDIRQVVSGRTSTSVASARSAEKSAQPPKAKPSESARALLRDMQKEEAAPTRPVATSAPAADDALAQLLLDAQEMQQAERPSDIDSLAVDDSDSSSSSMTSQIRNAVSTLVVADFFLVCFFLVWFLAGVFSSYVFGNDTIQIAFNRNFQQLVQPALGVLMIGALASAVVKDEDGAQEP